MPSEKRIVDYHHEGDTGLSRKMGEFFNRITYSNGKIRPGPAYAGLQIAIALGILLSVSANCLGEYIKDHWNDFNSHQMAETQYKYPDGRTSMLHGYDVDGDGSIDKIIETTTIGKTLVFQYHPTDSLFSKLDSCLSVSSRDVSKK